MKKITNKPITMAEFLYEERQRHDPSMTRKSRRRFAVIMVYGGKCQCCGEAEEAFLEIDHVFDDGRRDADTRRKAGCTNQYDWLFKRGFPRDRYQLLCSNCNQGKRRNGGVCPHIGKPGYPVAGARYPKAGTRPPDSPQNLVDSVNPTS